MAEASPKTGGEAGETVCSSPSKREKAKRVAYGPTTSYMAASPWMAPSANEHNANQRFAVDSSDLSRRREGARQG